MQALDVNSIPQGGTALAAAINTALTAFKEKGHFKALVLFTDGEDNDEGALEAAQNAAKAGLKIFTIGIGSAEGTLVTIAGSRRQYRLHSRRKRPGGENEIERAIAEANRLGDRRVLSAAARREHDGHAL